MKPVLCPHCGEDITELPNFKRGVFISEGIKYKNTQYFCAHCGGDVSQVKWQQIYDLIKDEFIPDNNNIGYYKCPKCGLKYLTAKLLEKHFLLNPDCQEFADELLIKNGLKNKEFKTSTWKNYQKAKNIIRRIKQ